MNAKATEIENKIPDTGHFINTQEFKRLTKISFDARIKEAAKSLGSICQVDKALDLGVENRK